MDENTKSSIQAIKGLKNATPAEQQYRADIERARSEGVDEGKEAQRTEILTWLQKKYFDSSLSRVSPEGQAIIKLVRELQEEFGNAR